MARFDETCFDQSMLKEDRCSRGGFFTSSHGECLSCPEDSFLSHPLSACTSDDASECCTNAFPSYNPSLLCKNTSRNEYGLQLFRRGPRRHVTFCTPPSEKSERRVSNPWIFEVAKSRGYVTYFGDEFCYEGSPFVAQGNVFPLAPDFELQRLYCRLQESRQYNFTASGPRLCAAARMGSGNAPTNPGFDLIQEMWHSKELRRVPKFIYLNAMAAHDYDPNWIKMVAVSEEYDLHLKAFLRTMMSDESFSNTMIVVRSDHGLQGGPMTMEYSMQVEHREPWVQIIMPRAMVNGDSLERLFVNQERLVTGHDLYRTLRHVIEPMTQASGQSLDEPNVPSWSYDIFHDIVPEARSCVDARVPIEFCPCEEQVHFRPPSLGVCNTYDQYGDLFCTDRSNVILPDVLEV